MVMAKNEKYPGGFYSNAVDVMGESEASGSSGRIDAEITISEDSSAPTRKCISLNSNYGEAFAVPTQLLSLSKISPSEKKELVHRLRLELEQIRILIKKVELHRPNGVAVSSSSDILSCSNGKNGLGVENFKKTSLMTPGPGQKTNPPSHKKGHSLNRGTSGRFESSAQASAPSTASAILMKQCDALLKSLMSHQHAWVFNTPIDVVKLNIPDYFTIIKHPMDLGTVKKKLASRTYSSPLEFLADVRLTFTNAMTYNPPGNDVHLMADTLSKFFEVRWKNIQKKLPKSDVQPLPAKPGLHGHIETAESMLPSKKRKATSIPQETTSMPAKHVMTGEERQNLGRELESLLGEMPLRIIDFLREHSSGGKECEEDEIEIDIDDLSDDTLFKLRKLLDDYLKEKQNKNTRAEPCEIELMSESGLSNSSMQPCKGSEPVDEDVDIGGNEPPVSSYPPVDIEKDAAHRNDSDSSNSSENEYDRKKASSPVKAGKVPETFGTEAQLEETTLDYPLERNQSVSGLDQVEQTSQQKPSSVESDFYQDGDSVPIERQVSPEKLYRAALLKNRFADTILRAREKTLTQGEKGDPEKLRRERVELELSRRKEKARLQAEAKAAEDARRQAEADAASEARRKRELEREAARQALLKMERTVEINENSRFLKDLEMLRTAPVEQLPSSVDETSPDHSPDGLGSFKFGGSNPLEQLGLFMKGDEEDEEVEPPSVPDPVNDVEEGEID